VKKYYILFFIFVVGLIAAYSQSKPLDISNVLLNFSNYQPISEKNVINGYAGLDSNSLILGENLFPSFATQPDGTIWVKSGSTFAPLSGALNISSSGISSKGVNLGNLTPSVVGVGLGSSSTLEMVIMGGASNKIYFAPSSIVGAAATNSYNSFSWKIDSGGTFSLLGGVFNGDISLVSNKILNASEVSGAALKIDLSNSIFDSTSFPITFSSPSGVFVPNTSISISSGGYALNIDSANLRYVKNNSSNTWTQPQTFSSTVSFSSPLSVSSGGTGVNSLGALKTSLGITSLPSGPNLNQLAGLTASQDAIIIGDLVGSSVEWTTKNSDQARTKLGLAIGTDIQKYSPYLQAIVDSATSPSNTLNGERYFFVLNGGSNVFERSTFSNLKSYLNISTYGASLISSANVNAAQSLLQIVPGFNVQSYSAVLTSIAGSTYTGSPSFSTLGNVTVGQWKATVIDPAYGGTGTNSVPSSGQVLIGNSSGTYTAASINGTANRIIVTPSSGGITISAPQDIATSSSPTFNSLSLSQVNGTPPFSVLSSTVVNNLNSDLLDGFSSNYFQVADPTLTSVSSGNYTGNVNLNILGNVTTGTWNASTIEIDRGGTGATTQAGARTNLGVTATGQDSTYLKVSNNLSDLGNATVARVNLGVTATGMDSTYLKASNNLSDLTSNSTARTNLGVTATGQDSTYLKASNNLSDLTSNSTARTNLGVTATGMDSTYLKVSNNLSDLTSNSTARTNLGVTATGMDSTYLKASNDLSDLGNATIARTNLGIGSGITDNKTFVDQSGTTHTITIVNGIITSWTP
jgi:hypothetical protein